MKIDKVLRENIGKCIFQVYYAHLPFQEVFSLASLEVADTILTLVKEAGYVKLAKDQSLPVFSFSEEPPNMRFGSQQAQQDMLNAGFRRLEL
mgnify:CR=1 FL=1